MNNDNSNKLILEVKKLSESAILPFKATELSAGYDLSSAEDTIIEPNGKSLIKTDLAISLPLGTYGRIAPRSSLAWRHHIDVGAGVIDGDYRGPIGIVLFNFSDKEFKINKGDKIAQLILEKYAIAEVIEVDELNDTNRGTGGFGSTN